MTAKEYLSQYRLLDLKINSKLEQVAELRAKATSVSSPTSDGGQGISDKVGRTVAKIVDLEKEVNEEVDRLIDLRASIISTIKTVDDEVLRCLLEERYINCKSWEQIAVDMHYSLRYQEAKRSSKRDIEVERKFWVLSEKETLSFIKVRPFENNSEKNACFSENNALNSEINPLKESKVKESKLKESKLEESKNGFAVHVLTSEEKNMLVSEFGKSNVEAYIQKMQRWKEKRNIQKLDEFAWLSKCLKQDNPPAVKDDASFDVDDLDKRAFEEFRRG